MIQVLVCTYQGEQFIAEQLDSIINQTYQNFEVHVFDDCSSDRTVKIVKSYCKNNNNFYLHENEKNIGFLKNFEGAINIATGKYLALCDQDDIWHTDKLAISMAAMKEAEEKNSNIPVLVHSDLLIIDHSGSMLNKSFFEKKKINLPSDKSIAAIMGHCGVMGNTILMNRSLVEKALPFPKGLKYHDYWLALINELYGARKTLLNRLVEYRMHDMNTSNNNNSNAESSAWMKRDYYLPFMEDHREFPIKYLLDTYELETQDKILIKCFYKYLIFKGWRLSNFIFLMKNNFLKKDFLYRISVFYRLMLTKRYGIK